MLVRVGLSVEANTSAVLSGVSSFIAGYNSYIGTANALSNYDEESGYRGSPVGRLHTTLPSVGRLMLSSEIQSLGLQVSITSLSELGITTSASGHSFAR